MVATLSKLKKHIQNWLLEKGARDRLNSFKEQGNIPWSVGYGDYKIQEIKNATNNTTWINTNVVDFGVGLDERIIEYPWILNRLSNEANIHLLDAGSTLNHDYILDHPKLNQKQLTICTYYPEHPSFFERRINYVYTDLRELPFKAECFDEIVCISTLEHIDMDNTMYGYDIPNAAQEPKRSFAYLKVVDELYRVVKHGGKILITVPFGKYEAHGFFQQFDAMMINRIVELLNKKGTMELSFYKYIKTGWSLSDLTNCENEESYNPHTGKGKKDDGAAHSRSICCIEFIKKG